MSWEDWKKQQKDIAAAENAAVEEEQEQMRLYRAQLDADRSVCLDRNYVGFAKARRLQR